MTIPRTCPDCAAEALKGNSLCPGCGRFVPGGDAGIRESAWGRRILVGLWCVLWPLWNVFGAPREAEVDVAWPRVLRMCVWGMILAGILVLAAVWLFDSREVDADARARAIGEWRGEKTDGNATR